MFVHILTVVRPANVCEIITPTTFVLVASFQFFDHGPLVSARFLLKNNFLYCVSMFFWNIKWKDLMYVIKIWNFCPMLIYQIMFLWAYYLVVGWFLIPLLTLWVPRWCTCTQLVMIFTPQLCIWGAEYVKILIDLAKLLAYWKNFYWHLNFPHLWPHVDIKLLQPQRN